MKFAKYYVGSCVKTTQMPIHIGIILHIVAKHNSKIFNGVDVLERITILCDVQCFRAIYRLSIITWCLDRYGHFDVIVNSTHTYTILIIAHMSMLFYVKKLLTYGRGYLAGYG